ncbi:MAG: transposase [Eubacteriales bacterium]|nr:transposase [Eubacteriales bacterium]
MSKYSKEFKEEALKLSDEIGVKKAALQLGLQYYTLAVWIKAWLSVEKRALLSAEKSV